MARSFSDSVCLIIGRYFEGLILQLWHYLAVGCEHLLGIEWDLTLFENFPARDCLDENSCCSSWALAVFVEVGILFPRFASLGWPNSLAMKAVLHGGDWEQGTISAASALSLCWLPAQLPLLRRLSLDSDVCLFLSNFCWHMCLSATSWIYTNNCYDQRLAEGKVCTASVPVCVEFNSRMCLNQSKSCHNSSISTVLFYKVEPNFPWQHMYLRLGVADPHGWAARTYCLTR